jgi:hypothetical protein
MLGVYAVLGIMLSVYNLALFFEIMVDWLFQIVRNIQQSLQLPGI